MSSYTPLLAYLMIPNILLHPLFGKVLLVTLDMVVGVLILKLQSKQSDRTKLVQVSTWLFNPFIFSLSARGSSDVVVTVLLFITFFYFQRNR